MALFPTGALPFLTVDPGTVLPRVKRARSLVDFRLLTSLIEHSSPSEKSSKLLIRPTFWLAMPGRRNGRWVGRLPCGMAYPLPRTLRVCILSRLCDTLADGSGGRATGGKSSTLASRDRPCRKNCLLAGFLFLRLSVN
jgi:hypothetical protein